MQGLHSTDAKESRVLVSLPETFLSGICGPQPFLRCQKLAESHEMVAIFHYTVTSALTASGACRRNTPASWLLCRIDRCASASLVENGSAHARKQNFPNREMIAIQTRVVFQQTKQVVTSKRL